MSIWAKTRLRAFKRSPAADDTILDRSFEDDDEDDDDSEDRGHQALHLRREQRHADLERRCREFLSRRAAAAKEARARWGIPSAGAGSNASSSKSSTVSSRYFTLNSSTASSDSSEDTDEGLGRSLSEESSCSGHAHALPVPPLQVKLDLLRVQLLDLVAADNALLSQLVAISGAIGDLGGTSGIGDVDANSGDGLRQLSAWRDVIMQTKDHEADVADEDEQQMINDLLDEALDLSVSDVDDDNVESPKSLRSSASKESSATTCHDDHSRRCIMRSASVAVAKSTSAASAPESGPLLQRQRVSFPATAKNRRKKSEPVTSCTLPASVARANREKKRSLALSRERLPPPPPPPPTTMDNQSSKHLSHAYSSEALLLGHQLHAEVVSVRGRVVVPERKVSTVLPPAAVTPLRTTVRVLANGSSSVVQSMQSAPGQPVPAVRTSVPARTSASSASGAPPPPFKARTTTISIPSVPTMSSMTSKTSVPSVQAVRVCSSVSVPAPPRSVLHAKQASVDSGVGAGATSTSTTSDSE